MVKVICEKTGIEFEAKTARTKNHPSIMRMIEDANKHGWYREALEACEAGKAAKLETVEEFLSLLEETKEAALHQQQFDYNKRLQEKREEREARRYAYIHRDDPEPETSIPAQYAGREIERNVFAHSHQVGEFVQVEDRILIVVSCEYVPGSDDMDQFDGGYAVELVVPNAEEMQSEACQRIAARIETEKAYDEMRRARYEAKREADLAAWHKIHPTPLPAPTDPTEPDLELLANLFAGMEDF